MIDIDHFKKINDSFGHDVGDEVLREFAVRLASNVRAIDLPCRYGGEEFVVIMPDTPLAAAERIAERIRLHVAGSPFRVGGGKELLSVTISIGVAATLGEADTAEALLKRADEAVYEAKAARPQQGHRQGRLDRDVRPKHSACYTAVMVTTRVGDTIAVLNRLEAEGTISSYAIAGAVAALRHLRLCRRIGPCRPARAKAVTPNIPGYLGPPAAKAAGRRESAKLPFGEKIARWRRCASGAANRAQESRSVPLRPWA